MLHQFYKYGIYQHKLLFGQKIIATSFMRNFTTIKEEVMEQQLLVKQPKNTQLDSYIDKLKNLKEARAFYFSHLPSFQDHHYILMLKRLQLISKLSNKQKIDESLFEKIEERIIKRIEHFDCDEVLKLLQVINKMLEPDQLKFIYQCLIDVSKRFQTIQFQSSLKELEVKKIIQLMINLNITYSFILSSPLLDDSITQSNKEIVDILSEVIKKKLNQQLEKEEIVLLIEQLSKFYKPQSSILKELSSKLYKEIEHLTPKQAISLFMSFSKLDIQADQKLINTLKQIIIQKIEQISYAEIGYLLESLLLLNQFEKDDIFIKLQDQLVERQHQYKQQSSEDPKEEVKLPIQDALKIFRCICQAGQIQQINNDSILKTFCNIAYKNLDKMTTNQVCELIYISRRILLLPISQDIRKRLNQVMLKSKEQFNNKIKKFKASRIVFMMLQDKEFKDQQNFTSNNEIKLQLFQQITYNQEDLTSIQDINMFVNLFKDIDLNQTIEMTLKNFNIQCEQIKKQVIAKKQVDKELDELFKSLYILCSLEVNDQHLQQPQIIQAKEYWNEIQKQISFLQNIKAFKMYQSKHPEIIEQISMFEQFILNDNKKILPQYINENEKDEEKQKEPIKGAKVQKIIQEIQAKNIDVESRYLKAEKENIFIDILLKEQRIALQPIQKIEISNNKFIVNKQILDKHNMLLIGDPNQSFRNKIFEQAYLAQLSPIKIYILKYYEGIDLKLVDQKYLKQDEYMKQLITK